MEPRAVPSRHSVQLRSGCPDIAAHRMAERQVWPQKGRPALNDRPVSGIADCLADSGRSVDAVSGLRHDGAAGCRHDTCDVDARYRDQFLQATGFGTGTGAHRNRHLRFSRASLHGVANGSIWVARRLRGPRASALIPCLAHAVLPVQAVRRAFAVRRTGARDNRGVRARPDVGRGRPRLSILGLIVVDSVRLPGLLRHWTQPAALTH